MTLPPHVQLTDVGPRDGLQNEKAQVATAVKVELIERLADAGVRNVESTSFVSPKWVPQMGDAAEVMAGIRRRPGVMYSVLTPNMKGFDGALAARADEVVIFGAASEAFSQRNINCSIAESIARFEPVARAAQAAGMRVRAAVSCALGCPYQGEVPVQSVADVVQRFAALGCDEIGIADTIGVGTAGQVSRVFEAAARVVPLAQISGHFHDTYGQALANVYACLQLGVNRFDASVGGLGGCPYAKGATGNVATEDVVYLLHGLGIDTGIDLDALIDAGLFISAALGKPYTARAGKALATKRDKVVA
ncbi:MAG: hydroxymethylglutaryl-CoA lyase [Betaproteobacteria bacterium]|nr:hydroxymethylglutaryl-CoA lyase [Betaproteobacteria bacterium]